LFCLVDCISGGWITGHRAFHSIPLLYSIAKSGWLVFTINYRLSPMCTHPSHLIDCKRAIAWIRENASQYGGDPSILCIGGESAGAHLSCLTALTPNNPYYQPGFEHTDTSVNGVVDLYGLHDFADTHNLLRELTSGRANKFFELVIGLTQHEHPAIWDQASPIYQLRHIAPDLIPPFFICHGDYDTLIPLQDAERFVEVLKQRRLESNAPLLPDENNNKSLTSKSTMDFSYFTDRSINDVFIVVPGASHAFNCVPSPRCYALSDSVCAFLNSVVGKIYNAKLRTRESDKLFDPASDMDIENRLPDSSNNNAYTNNDISDSYNYSNNSISSDSDTYHRIISNLIPTRFRSRL
jgi:acetyl esterase/lipase